MPLVEVEEQLRNHGRMASLFDDIRVPRLPITEAPQPASLDAKEVAEHTLRQTGGELRVVRHPVEMAAIEPKTRRLTALTRKFWLFLVSYALETEGTKSELGIEWRVPVATLKKDAAFNGQNTEHLKDSIRQCQDTRVEWASSARNAATGETRTWESTQLLASVAFVIDASGRHCVEWSFTPVLLRQLREHKHYFESSLEIAVALKRHSSLALYWVIGRYKTSPSGLTDRRPWREWISVLTGESEESAEMSAKLRAAKTGKDDVVKYKEWRYFNRDVINPAVKELNSVLPDVFVEARAIKEGRNVEYLQFKITPRGNYKRLPKTGTVDALDSKGLEAVGLMVDLGLTRKFATRLSQEHTPDLCIKVAREVTDRSSNKSRPEIKNFQGFFVSRLNEESAKRETETAGRLKTAELPPRSTSELVSESLSDYRAVLEAKAREDWNSKYEKQGDRETGLPLEVKDDYLRQFAESYLPAAPVSVQKEFAKSSLKSPIVSTRFYSWLAREIAGRAWEPSDAELVAFERARRSA